MANTFEIVDQDDAEDADFVVCAVLTDPLILPDNLIGECIRCGGPIQYAAHAPKRPPKVCQPCIMPDMQRDARKGELHSMITPKSAKQFADYLAKKRAN